MMKSWIRRSRGFALMVPALALAVAAPASTAGKTGPVYDIVIKGGTIVDGSGLPAFSGDVAIVDGYIADIGIIASADARQTIDAKGLVVAPGFFNIHSHAEVEGVSTAVNMLSQGVTTEIINADGYGTIDIAAQLPTFAAKGLAENIGAYAGFNAIWQEVMGDGDVRPTAAQIATMRGMVEKNLAAGAWGVSSGLDYRPAYYATPEEVVSIVSVARAWRTNFPNHDRLRPEDGLSSFKGMQETIAIAEQASLVPVITHIKSAGKERGDASKVLEMVAAAGARGAWTAIDIYPYLPARPNCRPSLFPAGPPAAAMQPCLRVSRIRSSVSNSSTLPNMRSRPASVVRTAS